MRLEEPVTLLGSWSLERVIDDRGSHQLSHVEGTLDLSLDAASAEGLCWEERATWRRSEGETPVSRTLRLAPTADGWWVRFADGRDFHPWRPGQQVVHRCGADTYPGVVSGTPVGSGIDLEWAVEWRVTGPEKDYTSTTRLRRSGGSGPVR